MKPRFADAYYYLALLNRDDDGHDRAVSLSHQLRGPTVTTTWVLTEVADAMAAVGARLRCAAFIEDLQRNPLVVIQPPTQELFDEGLGLYKRRADKEWSLTDCISFVVMRRRGLEEALTADRHFEQAGFKALLRQGPPS